MTSRAGSIGLLARSRSDLLGAGESLRGILGVRSSALQTPSVDETDCPYFAIVLVYGEPQRVKAAE